ncbi:sigma-70 family RNA polymerase sigma factor [bacterium]|nr:MAG: sigma-70 family RNA polymerase sigma factor [bacterium]
MEPEFSDKDLPGLYDRYSSLVHGLARRMLGNAQEAEDLTHEVFVSLLSRSTYDPSRGTVAAYLCTMTRSRSLDRLRARSRARTSLVHQVLEHEQRSPAAGEEVTDDEAANAVRAALAGLEDDQRVAIELAYFEGLSQTEVATRLGAPLGTVKSWTRRGLLQLRGVLKEFGEP